MHLRDFSALARIVDVRYPSNRSIVTIAGAGGAGTVLFRFLTDAGDPMLWGFRVAVAVFLGWAIARELDPDHPWSAAVAGPLAGLGVAMAVPELGAAAGFLIATRIVARSTGMSAHRWELVGLVGFVGYLAASREAWPAALALVWALWIDGGHPHATHPPSRVAAAGAAIVAAVVVVVTFPSGFELDRGWGSTVVFLIGIGAGWVSINRLRPPSSTGDHDKEPLSPHRLAQARLLAGAGLGFAAILTTASPATHASLWTATVAVAIVSLRPETQNNALDNLRR